MLRIWGKIVKNNKILDDDVVVSDLDDTYQENLKSCIVDLCDKFDIEKPYWLPYNVDEYNRRHKTTFNQNNFIDKIKFDKFVIEELNDEKNEHR